MSKEFVEAEEKEETVVEEEEVVEEEFKDIRKTCSLWTNCTRKRKGRKRVRLRSVGGVQEKECRATRRKRKRERMNSAEEGGTERNTEGREG